MKHIKTFNQKFNTESYPENWDDIKKELDEKSYYLDYPEITYAFSDLIDEEVIEIEDITKLYRYQKSSKTNNGVTKDAYYGVIKYDIKIKILDKSRVEEYINYRSKESYFLFREYYGYTILNGHSLDYFTKYYTDRDIDEFNLYSKAVWI